MAKALAKSEGVFAKRSTTLREKSTEEEFYDTFGFPHLARSGDEDAQYALSMLKVFAKLGDLAHELSIVEEEITEMMRADKSGSSKKNKVSYAGRRKLWKKRYKRWNAFTNALRLVQDLKIRLSSNELLWPLAVRGVEISKYLNAK